MKSNRNCIGARQVIAAKSKRGHVKAHMLETLAIVGYRHPIVENGGRIRCCPSDLFSWLDARVRQSGATS